MITDPREMRIDDFDYPLPDQRIARYPLSDRAAARLLTYREGALANLRFSDLPAQLAPGTLVIGNRTRVIHARLIFPLPTGRSVEIFCLEPLEPEDYARSLSSVRGPVTWKCLIGGNRRWKAGPLELPVPVGGRTLRLSAERTERIDNTFAVRFDWDGGAAVSFGELIEAAGTIPLPPYLGRAAEGEDRHRYQTVFAEADGSVAAPTAGLHFTPEVMDALAERDIRFRTLTLHVGAGTFKPVTSPTLAEHVMHREFFTVDRELLAELEAQIAAGRPVVSVGTTSMRCLESLYYAGRAALREGQLSAEIEQWVAADTDSGVATAPALRALIETLEAQGDTAFSGYTRLMLTPAAEVKVVDGLITNFHQPRSTLLLLVAAMTGDDWRRIYDHALHNEYRFLSYGDSSLLWRRRRAGAE